MAFVDTGTAFIEGPKPLVDNMQKLIGAKPSGSKVKGRVHLDSLFFPVCKKHFFFEKLF